jgi:hypothetical protein
MGVLLLRRQQLLLLGFAVAAALRVGALPAVVVLQVVWLGYAQSSI